MNRDDFPIISDKLIYFDNAATSLKPKVMIDKITEYYNNYSVNAHRGDYDLSLKVDDEYEKTREKVKDFINAKSSNEIVFTSGTTHGINQIVFGYFKHKLIEGDEILTTKTEHSAVTLPLFELKDEIGININYIPLENNLVTLDNIKKSITDKTKAIVIAHITNVIGDIRPIKQIIEYAHSKNIVVLIDAAQSIAHLKTDVQALDTDFLVFSAHKVLGPTGLGVIYGKSHLLEEMKPTIFGGGMNISYSSTFEKRYSNVPKLFEAGTPNIASIIAFKESIDYINNIGFDVIEAYEKDLTCYLKSKLKENDNIIIYNSNSESSIVTFNYKDVFAQDLAIYLNKYHICVRAGNHCAKMISEIISVNNTCRISLSFYNTKEEIDILIEALNNSNLKKEIIT
jgi:cysteine desulfurase / selenocysteine lyase